MRTSLLYRIISGIYIIKCDLQTYELRGISVFQKYLAEEYYEKLIEEYSQFDDMKTEGQLFSWMIKNKYWSEEDEESIKKHKTDLEDLKVNLFEAGFKDNEKKVLKDAIKICKAKLNGLIDRKHRFDFLTPRGAALVAKNRYLIGLSLYHNNKPVFDSNLELFLENDFPFLDKIIIEYNRNLISGEELRAIARSDIWRKYWCAKEADDIFGKSAIEWNDEQLNLVSWTRVYDNVYQHLDCPSEEVIDDDDCLDGFLIADKRKRDKEKGISAVDKLLSNDKIKAADEVFIPADTASSAKKIYDLNDTVARRTIQNREKLISEKGVLNNQDLPDVKQKQQMEINRKSMQLMKNA